MRRKFLILGAALAMMAGVYGCSSQGNATTTNTAQTQSMGTSTDKGTEQKAEEQKTESKDTSGMSEQKEQNETSGEKFPEFQAKTVDGEDITNDVFKDNKLTVVNVWGSWCGPCVQEIPELQKLYENMKDKGVNVIGIAQDASTDMDAVKEVIEGDGVTYKNIVPSGSVVDFIMKIQAFPTTYFVDGEGNIVSKIEGSRDLETFTQIVEDITAKM